MGFLDDVVGGVGNLVNGVLGGGDAPDRKNVDLNPKAKELIKAGVNRAMRSPEEYAAERNAGVDNATQVIGPNENQLNQQAAQMGQDPAMLKAISNVYQGQAGQQIARLKSDNNLKSGLMKAESLKRMAHAAIAQQNVETQNFERLTDAYNQNEIARAQFVSSLFQVGRQAYIGSKMKVKSAPNFSMGDMENVSGKYGAMSGWGGNEGELS